MAEVAQPRQWARRVALGAALLIVVGCAVGLRGAWPRLFPDLLAQGRRAYDRGDWTAAAQAARAALEAHEADTAALRLLARSQVQLGRDDSAIALYTQRLGGQTIQAEDYFLLGVALKRRGRPDAALQAWNKALDADPNHAPTLDELTQLYYQGHRGSDAARTAEQLAQQPGWEARGDLLLGIILAENKDVSGAAAAMRRALSRDPKAPDQSPKPAKLRKLFARTFLQVGRPAAARPPLEQILARGPDPEASWLLSRVYLQEGNKAGVQEALARAGSYRAENPLEDEPSPYVGEAQCAKCHPTIFAASLASRHTQSYYRGDRLKGLPRPERPLPDPDDPQVTHAIRAVDGTLREETRVGGELLRLLVDYAFGTSDRYVTMVGRDARGRFRALRLSYFCTADGQGWDRTAGDETRPARADDFQGQEIDALDGVVRCLYCHTTNTRAGRERVGPETADRAIGCERCHGPGRHHIAAVEAELSDLAIVNPATAAPALSTAKVCNDCHILDVMTVNADPEDRHWARSQGAGWTWSRCNTESSGAFGCVTCHDPHQSARATTTAQYEAKCLSCHGGPPPGLPAAAEPDRKVCPVDPVKGCIQCHMPRVRMGSLHMDLTDHYIRVQRKKKESRAHSGAGAGRRPDG
jgi:predicted CXXCH cytochrome family protein